MSTTVTTRRRHRFTRDRRRNRDFVLTERDELAIRCVARFRMLNTDQITAFVPGSPAHFARRLRELYDHKYLDRPPAQIYDIKEVRQLPTVYALGEEGARFLARTDCIPLDHLKWQLKNARVEFPFTRHTLDIASAMIHVLRAADHAGWQVVDHFDLKHTFPETTDKRRKRNPFSLTVRFNDDEHAVVPDRLFSLHQDGNRLNFALEADRGVRSMPVHRTFFDDGTALTNKMRLYWQAWIDKAHQEAWAFKQFRVLIVTSSDARIATVRKRIAEHNLISNPDTKLFLMTTRDRLAAEGAFALIWDTIAPAPRLSLLESTPQVTTSLTR